MSLILALAKKLKVREDLYRNNEFSKVRKSEKSVELEGKTLGLVGLGHIGSIVARICRFGFNMNVLAYDPFVDRSKVDDWIEIVDDKKKLFSDSDFISIHIPLSDTTRNLVGKEEFSCMKGSACFINTARGGIVDENALIQALEEKRIAGAGLDATEPEPAPTDSPLFEMDNVILTPHCGGSTLESKKRSSLGAAKGCDEILTGKVPTSLVL